MIWKTLPNNATSEEIMQHEDRLRHRLAAIGFKLKRANTISKGKKKINLKKTVQAHKGYQIVKADTGEVLSGKRFELTLRDVENFWSKELYQASIRNYAKKGVRAAS